MVFGLSFGSQKSKSQTEIDKEVEQQRQVSETGTQQQVGSQAQTQTGTTTTTAQQASQQARQEQVASTGTAQTTGQTAQQTQQFTDEVLAGLNELFTKGIASSGSQDALSALTQASASRALDFDAQAFIEGQVGTAQQEFEDVVLPSLRTAASAVGGTAGTNSAVNLLTQIAADRQARNVAGVRAGAAAEAENIIRENLTAAAGIAGQENASLAQLGELLRGAFTEQTGTTEQATATEQEQASTGRTSGTQTTQSEQQTQQDLVSIIQSLIANQKQLDETGRSTESQDISQKSKGSSFGAGLSLGG